MNIYKRGLAELLGTLWLVLGGCGSAVLAGDRIGWHGVALAFGLTVVTGAYAVGHISGGHFNPAVSIGLWAGRRFPAKDLPVYIVAQLIGATIAALIIWGIATGKMGFSSAGGLAANGYGDHSPSGYSAGAAFATEFVMTFMFLIVIMGATDKRTAAGFAPLAIGLALTLIHLISIPVTNTSVNPARSFGPAVVLGGLGGGWALEQLWMFIVAPILGAIAGAVVYCVASCEKSCNK